MDFEKKMNDWLVISTHLKNISQIGSFPQVGVKTKHIWSHHLDEYNGGISLDNICLISSWGLDNYSHRIKWCHGVGSVHWEVAPWVCWGRKRQKYLSKVDAVRLSLRHSIVFLDLLPLEKNLGNNIYNRKKKAKDEQSCAKTWATVPIGPLQSAIQTAKEHAQETSCELAKHKQTGHLLHSQIAALCGNPSGKSF